MESLLEGSNCLPKGWDINSLGDIVEILDKHRKPINAEEREWRVQGKRKEQLYPYYGATGQVGLIDGYLLDGQYILLGEDGAPFLDFGKNTAYLVKGKIWVNNHAHILKAYISDQYLCHYLNQVDYHKYVTGTTRLKLNQASMRQIKIKIPPLPEQHRIVDKIEELFSDLDDGIASLKKAQQQLKVYRQAVLKWAFEGKLTAQWREEQKRQGKLESAETLLEQIKAEREQRYQAELAQWKADVEAWEANGKVGKRPGKPKKLKEVEPLSEGELGELPKLPDGWQWTRWENVLDFGEGAFKRGPFGSTLKKEFFVEKSRYKVYEQYCPINDDCSFERYYISEEKFNELESFAVRAQDFLISCSGVTLGRITQVPMVYQEGIINQALLRVRINKEIYNFDFFKQFFRSSYFQKRIFENSTGTAIPNVKGVKELKAIAVPLCCIQEQLQIVEEIESRLSICDNFDATIADNLQRAEALRQSILKQAFEGKLVPQDPNDEPASVLIERIQAAKASQSNNGKKTRKNREGSTQQELFP